MQTQINIHTQQIETIVYQLAKHNDPIKAKKLQHYIGTQLNVLGILTKTQVNACKQGYGFYTDDLEKTVSIYNDIYFNSTVFEVKNQAFIYIDKNYKNISIKTLLKILPNWVTGVDNWAHSDYLSKFLTRLIEHPSTNAKMIAYVKKWSNSTNLWERRQALVCLYYYARTKKQHVDFDLSAKIILKLINDSEYFVQKAIGWTLRESYNVYPIQTFELIKQNIKNIKPTAFTTCIEKMTIEQKTHLKKIRK